jgi:hypothetical protein
MATTFHVGRSPIPHPSQHLGQGRAFAVHQHAHAENSGGKVHGQSDHEHKQSDGGRDLLGGRRQDMDADKHHHGHGEGNEREDAYHWMGTSCSMVSRFFVHVSISDGFPKVLAGFFDY